jgi:ligand-binding sensor domain-containing protein
VADWQHFTAAIDGIASSKLFAIAEAPDGSILFGTNAGASRYDGTRWTTYLASGIDATVKGFVVDSRGRSWFGTSVNGVLRWDGSQWTRYNLAGGELPGDQVRSLLVDHAGDIWIATFGGLARYEPGPDRWTRYTTTNSPLVHSTPWTLLEDRAHQLWIGTAHGVSRLDPSRTQWSNYTQDPQALGRDSVLAIGEDADGGIWFGTDQGAWRLLQSTWSHFTIADGLPTPQVTAFARDGQGRLWIGGFNGVARYEAGTIRPDVKTSDGAFFGQVNALAVDHSGGAWIGTDANGLFRYDGVDWHHYFSNDPTCTTAPSANIPSSTTLASNCLSASHRDGRGELWFATANRGTSRLRRNGAWSSVARSATVLASDSIVAIAHDVHDQLWFGSQSAGVAVFDSVRTSWALYTAATGLASDTVVCLHASPTDEVWVGTANGLSRWHSGAWTSWLRGEPGVGVSVDEILDDDLGNLWLRTSAGLWSLDVSRTQLAHWTTAEGLADDEVDAMLRTRDGALWFGTPQGLTRHEGATWTSWTSFGIAGDVAVGALAADSTGGVWAGVGFDAAHWDGASWQPFGYRDIGIGPVRSIYVDPTGAPWLSGSGVVERWNGRTWRRYDSSGNGLAGLNVTAMLSDAQGRLWLTSSAFGGGAGGGPDGLAEHDPDRTAPQTVFVTQPAALSPSRAASFAFGAAYGESADLEFSSAMDGETWQPWTPITSRSFAGLADGPHVFSVRSRDWVGNVDTTAATYAFEVDATPPAAVVSFPAFGLPIRGTIAIRGTAADARFRTFTVQARREGVTSWTAAGVLTLAASFTPANDDTLAVWNTTGLADGNWELRLAVEDTLGLVGIAVVRAIVDNLPPYANVTSPVLVVAASGGEVFTTNAEAHAYFPPGAFDADATVNVDSLAAGALPDTLPGGAVRAGTAWSVTWTGGNLLKAATLDLRPAPGAVNVGIYREDSPGQWRHVGGSPRNGAVSLEITAPGRYALYSGLPAAGPTRRLSAISLSPRVFSPSGAYGGREIAIAFTLSQPGAATVRIYNRAGRLVRTVAEGWNAGTGQNLVRWNGLDSDGHVAEAGLYLVNVKALGESRTQALGVVR